MASYVAVVGGLTVSTLITLVLIPAVYSLFHPEWASRKEADEGRALSPAGA